jgi:hypothetical protein
MGFAEVRRAAVLSHRGRRLLMVEMISGSARALVDRLQSELQWAKLDAVHVVEQLPVDSRHNAKIDYPALRKLVERLEPT